MKTLSAHPTISTIGDVVTSIGRVDPMDFYRGMKNCISGYELDLNNSDRPHAIQSLQVSRHLTQRKAQIDRLRGTVQK